MERNNMEEDFWIEDTSRCWFTPGGDPVWKCPYCGNGLHIYGVENWNHPEEKCKDCGRKLKYPVG